MMNKLRVGGRVRKYALIAVIALMLISVVALADVIYYYKGVITAQVSPPPLVFYNGTFTYTTPSGLKCTAQLNSYVSNYANFTATSWGLYRHHTANKRNICILLPRTWTSG
ncbi:hypothetical protein [Vulcanisaeta distributa]|uniref:hypothetical protein n=1 Tax=Vulcanisaeta distributa TaxID=164451 RepID=UPI0006D2A7D0|nr:hypothetical protein [Vulcanisaeta distributa]